MMVHPLMFALLLRDPADDVRARLQTYVEATRTYDAKTLDSLLHPAYVEVSPLGELDERSRVLSFYRFPEGQAPPMPERITLDEFAVRFPAKDVAVAVFRETAKIGGAARAFRATVVLKRERSVWLLFSTQATGLRPTRSAP